MKAIRDAWKTLTDTLNVVGQSGNYYLYPLLSFIIMLLVIFAVIIPLLNQALITPHGGGPRWIFLFCTVCCMYGGLYFITTFFHVALVSSIAGQLDGDAPSFGSGISKALQRIGPIARYTLVLATLGLLSILVRRWLTPFFGGIIVPLIGSRLWLGWRQLSYNIPLLLAVPVIALDQAVPYDIFKRAELLVKATWGERVKPAHSIGLLALLVLLPIILLFALPALQQGFVEQNAGMIRLGSGVLLVSILVFSQLNGLVNAIFGLAAYRYAATGKSDLFPGDASYAEQAFVEPKKEANKDTALIASLSGSPSAIADESSN